MCFTAATCWTQRELHLMMKQSNGVKGKLQTSELSLEFILIISIKQHQNISDQNSHKLLTSEP